ncbi:hypothetical protein [Pseudomonas sp. SO81]|uniref:hypothetical protein n=1 Tax=Pseudomonas sp. SO81 TaxID=2983246 RepID=UPI0025A3DBD1|nr:hypothetical protein [Pseudomonas sp. SO81]WJN61361.1 hypothetical protein OH686_21670 [Pseudomonas sp. SO81]
MNDKHRFIATDLGLAIQYANGRANTLVDCSDDIDPDLICPGIEEEEEEEEEDPDDEQEEEETDRGDEVDPALKPEEEDDPDLELEEEEEQEEELDPEALAELAESGGKAKAVPHARFNEVNTALKAERAERLRLEEELARAKGGGGAKPEDEEKPKPFDFDGAEDRYMDAVLDGDKDKARAIRAEIRTEERKLLEQEGAKAGKQSAAEELRQRDTKAEQDNIDKVATAAQAKYPFLDPQSKEANADAIEDVVARRNYYMQQGMAPSKALSLAVEKIAPRYVEKADEPGRKPGEKPQATEAQIRKNLERDKQIPQAPAGVGERGKDIDYAKLSEDEFDALPAEEKKKARGDYVKEA